MSDSASANVNTFRSGRYIQQPAGYRAFIPATLPPDTPVRLAGELQSLLSRADRALGRLDGSIHTLPHPDLFVAMYVRKEAGEPPRRPGRFDVRAWQAHRPGRYNPPGQETIDP